MILTHTDNESKKMPIVSVCCLAYNHEKTIGQTIKGVISQKTSFPFEFIIHDDASTDNTAAIIKEYAEKYPDIIKPIFQKENKYFTCNLAKKYLFPNVSSTSEYIAICEGDDYWTDENKLQMQFEIMKQNPDITMTFHAVNQLNPNGEMSVYRPLKKSKFVDTETIIKRGGMFCPSVSLVFRRDVADDWPDFRLTADVYDYPAQILAAVSGKVYYFDKIMGVYRFGGENSWTAEHSDTPDRTHTNNEVAWLNEFNGYSGEKYSYAVNYHLAHLWLCEYKKSFDKNAKTECLHYALRLKFFDKLIFKLLIIFFALLGKKANKIWCFIKKHLFK